MEEKKSDTRREFLKKSAIAAASFTIVPRFVLDKGYIAPSDQLTKGIVGVGGMGRNHIPYGNTRVVAICDVDKNHIQEATRLIPNSVKTFGDYRELITLPEVDIV